MYIYFKYYFFSLADNSSSVEITNMEISTTNIHEISKKNIHENVSQCDFENVQCEEIIYETPPKKRICYAGDIKCKVEKMSPEMLIKSINILKKTCNKKDKIINRLRVQHYRQKKKIESLESLLNELRTKGLISPTSSDIVEVFTNKTSALVHIN